MTDTLASNHQTSGKIGLLGGLAYLVPLLWPGLILADFFGYRLKTFDSLLNASMFSGGVSGVLAVGAYALLTALVFSNPVSAGLIVGIVFSTFIVMTTITLVMLIAKQEPGVPSAGPDTGFSHKTDSDKDRVATESALQRSPVAAPRSVAYLTVWVVPTDDDLDSMRTRFSTEALKGVPSVITMFPNDGGDGVSRKTALSDDGQNIVVSYFKCDAMGKPTEDKYKDDDTFPLVLPAPSMSPSPVE